MNVKTIRHYTNWSIKNNATVTESVAESSGISIRYRSRIRHFEKHYAANSH